MSHLVVLMLPETLWITVNIISMGKPGFMVDRGAKLWDSLPKVRWSTVKRLLLG